MYTCLNCNQDLQEIEDDYKDEVDFPDCLLSGFCSERCMNLESGSPKCHTDFDIQDILAIDKLAHMDLSLEAGEYLDIVEMEEEYSS